MRKGYRIISVEAADIYKHEQTHGVAVGFKMPEEDDACFWLFKNVLDASLDLGELEKAYKRICRKKFSFRDKCNNEYTLAVINVKFNYICSTRRHPLCPDCKVHLQKRVCSHSWLTANSSPIRY